MGIYLFPWMCLCNIFCEFCLYIFSPFVRKCFHMHFYQNNHFVFMLSHDCRASNSHCTDCTTTVAKYRSFKVVLNSWVLLWWSSEGVIGQFSVCSLINVYKVWGWGPRGWCSWSRRWSSPSLSTWGWGGSCHHSPYRHTTSGDHSFKPPCRDGHSEWQRVQL